LYSIRPSSPRELYASPGIEQCADPARADIEGQMVARVPLAGHVAAGTPILANERIEDVIPLPR
jgi:hypothetical protein